MYTIRKLLRFEAAHVLDSSYSKCCQQIHGHSYLVELFFRSETLNADGMVVDFGLVKETAGPLIDKWDHALIVSSTNSFFNGNPYNIPAKIVTVPYNPTAENMAFDIYRQLSIGQPTLFKVQVHETKTGWASYERGA